jgi:lipopolysaccharide export system protein LptC
MSPTSHQLLGGLRERLPILTSICMLALLAGLTALLAHRAAMTPRGPATLRDSLQPDWFVEGFQLIRLEEQSPVRWRIVAQRMQHQPQDDVIELRQATLTRNEALQPDVVIQAEQAKMLELGDVSQLRGAVTIERAASTNEATLKIVSDDLDLFLKEDRASTAGPVRIERGGLRLNAIGMQFENVVRHLALLSAVHGRWLAQPSVTPPRDSKAPQR